MTGFAERFYHWQKPVAIAEIMTKPALIYHPSYVLKLGDHVFPGRKYPLVYQAMADSGLLNQLSEIRPKPLTAKQLALVHSPEFVHDFLSGIHTYRTYLSELPLDADIVRAFLLMGGGTLLAAREALTRGRAINLAGGFHHSYPCHSEGFCYINDVAIAVRCLMKEELIKRACIIDLDIHQGNGTAFIFRQDDRVFTFSIHQEDIYPNKENSDKDIGLRRGVDDQEYLGLLQNALEGLKDSIVGDLIMIVAGADPLLSDSLGHTLLTPRGLLQRDQMLVGWAEKLGVAIVFTLGGGYGRRIEDTVEVHLGTAKAMVTG